MDDPPRFPPGMGPRTEIPQPAPVSDLDRRAEQVLGTSHRTNSILGWVSIVAVAVLIGVVIFQQATISSQQRTIDALVVKASTEQARIEADIAQVNAGSCTFYQVLGTLPVVTSSSPGSPRTSIVGYNLIEGARAAYLSFSQAARRGHVPACPASAIGVPSKQLRELARIYKEPPPR